MRRSQKTAAIIGERPWMEQSDVDLIEARLVGNHLPAINVLEWGSGGSTVHFPAALKSKGIKYHWLSLEYNASWYSHITALTRHDIDIEVVLFDVGNNELQQRNAEMQNYIHYPASLNQKFDVIIIDGRKRRRCLLEAARLLNSGGAAFLHDAERTYYHCAFSSFRSGEFLSKKLWVGTA